MFVRLSLCLVLLLAGCAEAFPLDDGGAPPPADGRADRQRPRDSAAERPRGDGVTADLRRDGRTPDGPRPDARRPDGPRPDGPTCGNGALDPGEQCDKAIAAGKKGACPKSCDDNDPCTVDSLSGTAAACTARCTNTAKKPCCGNGIKEAGEQCDKKIAAGKPGACPKSCNDGDACTKDALLGTAAACTARCTTTPITPCCGNGTKEAGEWCDKAIAAGKPGSCPKSCNDGDPCTLDKLLGTAATCTARCSYPAGPCCGNGKKETGEQCDDGNQNPDDTCTNACKLPGGPLLISEVALTVTSDEFIEIYNPAPVARPLDAVYLADYETYYEVVKAGQPPYITDFAARFPGGSSIGPGAFAVVAVAGAVAYRATFGKNPDFELVPTDPVVPDMVAAVPGGIGSSPGLANTSEVLVLFSWDGGSDLVGDLDYIAWGTPQGVDKSGVCIDGVDLGTQPSCYQFEIPVGSQARLGGHSAGGSLHRCNFAEGSEKQTGGNGITGHDETHEPLGQTWSGNSSTPSLRTPGAPPPKAVCP